MAVFDCSKINLRRGSRGANVKTLQTHLKTLGYYTRQIDGSFGYYTQQAVKKFQRTYKLSVDGVFGAKTCKKFNEVLETKNIIKKETSKNNTTITNNNTNSTPKDNTPEYLKQDNYRLVILPEVVVLPTVEATNDTKNVTGGSIETEATFDCSKINLRKGSKGDDVTKLQTILKARGYYTRKIDGSFGNYTRLAVKKLQKSQGNTQDGVFGQKTCSKLQGTSATSNKATNTENRQAREYIITEFEGIPNITTDLEGFTQEITLQINYSQDLMGKIRKLQKTEFTLYKGNTLIKEHIGYINDIKISNEEDKDKIELSLTGYNVFLEQTIEIPEDVTALRSELLKKYIEGNGLHLNLNLDHLTDSQYTLKAQKTETTTDSSGGGEKTISECFDMAKGFIHPYHDGKYQENTSTHDPEKAYASYQKGIRHFDCFGTSAFLFYVISNFAKKGVRVIHRRSRAAKSGTHYTVQIKENGQWVDPKTEYNKLDSYLRVSSGAIAGIHQVYEG